MWKKTTINPKLYSQASIQHMHQPHVYSKCWYDLNFSACPYKPADIVFVLDGSGSEGTVNFRKQLTFVANFSGQFEIGPNHTRIGLVTFATAAHNEFYLTDNLSEPNVMQRINQTQYPNGETNTHKAIDLVRIQQFLHRYDNRNVTKIVIVLTDGLSLEPTLLANAARQLKVMHCYGNFERSFVGFIIRCILFTAAYQRSRKTHFFTINRQFTSP